MQNHVRATLELALTSIVIWYKVASLILMHFCNFEKKIILKDGLVM